MEANFEKKDNRLDICVKGRLDTLTSKDLMEGVDSNMDETVKDVNIDCSGLEYISSSGLRIFMTLYKKTAPKGGKVTLTKLTPQVCEVLNITGMATLFNIE